MTPPIEALRAAVQEYVRATSGDEGRVVTEFVLLAASIDLHTADSGTYYTDAASGAHHACLGLAGMLIDRFDLQEDDE